MKKSCYADSQDDWRETTISGYNLRSSDGSITKRLEYIFHAFCFSFLNSLISSFHPINISLSSFWYYFFFLIPFWLIFYLVSLSVWSIEWLGFAFEALNSVYIIFDADRNGRMVGVNGKSNMNEVNCGTDSVKETREGVIFFSSMNVVYIFWMTRFQI